jgi:FHS family L-fucose permease-like MFS transporter
LGPAPSSTRTLGFAVESPIETDRRAMTVATALFFMVGIITCLNDVIIPHLKSIFELTYAEAMLVQFAFFSSYFVFSYPGGKVAPYRRQKQRIF